MYAQVEAGLPARAPLSSGGADPHNWVLILPALVVGIGAVLHESSWHQTDVTRLKQHAIFGSLLLICVMTQFLLGISCADRAIPATIERCARQLARQVYLVAYLLAGARALQYFAYSAGSGADLAHSMQALQPYFGCALVALISVKAASYWVCARSSCDPV